MQLRNNTVGGSVVLMARSANAIVVDDKVTIPVSFSASEGTVIFTNLPTSSSGLAVGQLWNNGGILNVKQ